MKENKGIEFKYFRGGELWFKGMIFLKFGLVFFGNFYLCNSLL